MSLEKTRTQLNTLIANRENQVVALSGKWGTGKTHLWGEIKRTSREEAVKESLYVSLFGLSNVDQIKRKLMEGAIPGSADHSGALAGVKNLMEVGLKALSEHYKAMAALSDLNLLLLAPATLRNKLVVIDDLERKHERLGVIEILGFINEFSKQHGVRFLLVLNDDQLGPSAGDGDVWTTFREKVIDQEVKLKTSPAEAFGIAAGTWPSRFARELANAVAACQITNIRIIGKIIRAANQVLGDRDLPDAVLRRVIPPIVFFAAIHYRGLEDGPDTQFALSIGYEDYGHFLRSENAEPSEQEKRQDGWRRLMTALGIERCTDFEMAVVEYHESGLVDAHRVHTYIDRYASESNRLEKHHQARNFIRRMIWDHRASYADHVAEAQGFVGDVALLDPYITTELHDLFVELDGGAEVAAQLIESWIQDYQAKGSQVEEDDGEYTDRLHPSIAAAFDRATKDNHEQTTLLEACQHLVDNRSWRKAHEFALRRSTPEQFATAIRAMHVDSLPEFMRRMLEIGKQRQAHEERLGSAIENFVRACRGLADDTTPENVRLAKLMRTLFEKSTLRNAFLALGPNAEASSGAGETPAV